MPNDTVINNLVANFSEIMLTVVGDHSKILNTIAITMPISPRRFFVGIWIHFVRSKIPFVAADGTGVPSLQSGVWKASLQSFDAELGRGD